MTRIGPTSDRASGMVPAASEPAPVLVAATVQREGAVGFSDLIQFFRRHGRLILLASLAAGALVALLSLALVPPRYQAAATLVVMPPRFSSELKPQPMSILGLQRLLEADAVIGETTRRLVAAGLLQNQEDPRVGEELRSRVYVARRAEGTPLAPVIELIAHGASAETAAELANTWAEVSLEYIQELQSEGTTANIDLIETQFEKSNERVRALDVKLLDAKADFQAQISKAQIRWRRTLDKAEVGLDRRLVELAKETEDLTVAYQLETRRVMEELAQSRGLAMARSEEGSPDEVQLPSVFSPTIEQQLLKALMLRIQLAQTPPFLTLEKAVSNDALWQATVIDQIDVQSLASFVTEEVNPVHTDLTRRLSDLEFSLENAITDGSRAAWRLIAGLEEVQRQRSAGLSKLLVERLQLRDELEKEKLREIIELRVARDAEIDILERQRDTALGQLKDRRDSAQALFAQIAEQYNQAELARREHDLADVRVGARAVPPSEPRPRRLILRGVVGLLLGGLVGVLAALVRESEQK